MVKKKAPDVILTIFFKNSGTSPNVVWVGGSFCKSTMPSNIFGLPSGVASYNSTSRWISLKSSDFFVLRKMLSQLTMDKSSGPSLHYKTSRELTHCCCWMSIFIRLTFMTLFNWNASRHDAWLSHALVHIDNRAICPCLQV